MQPSRKSALQFHRGFHYRRGRRIAALLIFSLAMAAAMVQNADSMPEQQSNQSAPQQPAPSAPGMGADRTAPGQPKVRYPADVAGQIVADNAFRKFPKRDGWSQDLREVCRIRRASIATETVRLQKIAVESKSPFERAQAEFGLAELSAYLGDMNTAIQHWEAAYQIAQKSVPAGVPQLEEVLGAAYYHKSEMENDVYRSPGERCLFPPPLSMRFEKTGDSEQAIAHLLNFLKAKPGMVDSEWLLNLAYMSVGKYPGSVPKRDLIPLAPFESKQNTGRFVDVAHAAGLDLITMAGGIIVDDFDNDGLLDIITSSYDVCEPMHFFHNNGDGTFTERGAQAGLADQLGGLNMVQADYNNDGCMDILVLRGAWEFPIRKSLLRNNCDGTFTDVTGEAGLAEPATSTQTAVWVDIDNDGLLDLFVGNENSPSQLFRNKGDGTFEDISHHAGIDRTAFTKAVVAGDYDNDGYPDLYVSNLYSENFLYHNNHDRTFTDVGAKAGVQKPQQSFAAWFFDYDNDGLPDIFVNGYYFSADESIRSYLGLPHTADGGHLYKNLGDGTFKDVTAETGTGGVYMTMGANFGDVDNDGFLDIYLGNGGPEYGALAPNTLLRNDAGKKFMDITASSHTGDIHKGHGIGFADLDNDGNEDIIANLGGATLGDAHALRLFPTSGRHNDWISLKLVGVKTNRAAIGARIKVSLENKGLGTRSIYRTVGSGGSFGASPMEQHVGLGPNAGNVKIEIDWPVSKTHQTFANVHKNQAIEIQELAHDYKKLVRKRIRLGATNVHAAAHNKARGATLWR